MANRTLRYVPLDDLRGHPGNPKNHDGDLIGASIDRFGYVEPQVLDERTGLLIAGHGRLDELRAKQAAADEDPPDGIRVVKGRWFVPVVHGWSSADDDEARAYLVASNESTIAGGWDLPQLGSILDELAHTDVGLDGTGYDPARLDLLLSELEQTSDLGTDPSAEWVGMPDFDQPDLKSKYTTTVHFLNEADFERFSREVLGAETARRTAWWPGGGDGHKGSDLGMAYVATDDGD